MRAYFPRQLGLGVGAEGSPKYVALIATRCILGPTNLGCQNPQIGTARITVSAASKKKFKLPSRTLGKGKLVNGNAGAGARVVPGAAMKKRLRALYKKWDAKGNPKWYVRATVTLRLTSPITETLTRSGRYELDSAVQGPIVGSKGDTYPCGGCNR